jgi:hypothetical protein
VSAGVFQKLVAFYSDRLDWTNKHRDLRLYPVMTLSTQPLASANEPQLQVQNRRRLSESTILAAQHRAIEVALKIHAMEWCERLGIAGLRTECDPKGRRVALRSSSGKILKSWVIPMDRFRLPL